MAELDKLNLKLKESEAHYRTLFYSSPLPKWIHDTEAKQIRQVNAAAVSAFGYTEEELLSRCTTHLIPEYSGSPLKTLHEDINFAPFVNSIQQLNKKNGQTIYIEVTGANIVFEGQASQLMIAKDITERVENSQKMRIQNEKLREIAFMQAHVIRAPLTKIMALSDLIAVEHTQFKDDQLFIYLSQSTRELDKEICGIIDYTESILEQFPLEIENKNN